MQEVEQTLSILSFCVVSLVILQTRSYEQHATNFAMLQNDKYLCFYGSKRYKMLSLDHQNDRRTIWNKKFHFCKQFLQKDMKNHMEINAHCLLYLLHLLLKSFWILVVLPLKSAPRYHTSTRFYFFFFKITFENKPNLIYILYLWNSSVLRRN